MSDKKGVVPDERGGGKEVGEGETVFRLHCIRKEFLISEKEN